jgi:hypothetical protein
MFARERRYAWTADIQNLSFLLQNWDDLRAGWIYRTRKPKPRVKLVARRMRVEADKQYKFGGKAFLKLFLSEPAVGRIQSLRN